MAQSTPVHSGYTIINGTTTGSNGNKVNTWIEYKVTSRSIANNTSTLSVYLYARANTSGLKTEWDKTATYGSITVAGTSYSGPATSGYSFKSTSTYNLFSYKTDITITHTSDGSKSISISGTWNKGSSTSTYITGGSVSSTTVVLPTIPRTSTFTVPSFFYLGTAGTIYITRASDTFTHTVTYAFGSHSASLTGQTTSANITFPTSWADAIPTTSSGTGTITVSTYSGNTLVGSSSQTVQIKLPATGFNASIGSISDAEGGTVVPAAWGVYINGKSRLKITLNDVAASTGSSITSYSISGAGYTGTTNPYTTGTLNVTGSQTITAKVTDARGKTATKTKTITVNDYSVPVISNVSVYRCNSSGTADDDGTYCYIKAKATVTRYGSYNAPTFEYRVKTIDGTWSSYTTLTSETATIKSGILTSSGYDIEIRLSDYFTSTTAIRTINRSSSSDVPINFNASGSGVGIGGMSTTSGKLEVYYPTDFKNGVTVDGEGIVLKMFNDTSGTDWKTMLKAKVDYVRANGMSGKTYIMQGGWAGQAYGYAVIYWTNTYVVCDFYGLGGRWYRCVYNGSDYSYYCFSEDSSNDYTYNGLTIRARRRGSTCDIYVTGTTTSDIATSGATVTLCTLPEIYRPMYSYVNLVFMQANLMGQLNITTAGAVNLGYTHTITTSANVDLASGTSIWARTTYAVQ